jgi:hypothetical protein
MPAEAFFAPTMPLLHGCPAVLTAFACRHGDVLLYLVPSLALAFLIRMLSSAHPFFFIFTVAGTCSHELAHFCVGLLAGARPTGFTIIPRRVARKPGQQHWELGSVTFANIRWYNAAPAALAPLLGLGLPFAVAYWRTAAPWHFAPLDLALMPLLAPQLLSFWPSRVDWRIAVRSWPYLVIIGVVAALVVWYPPALFQDVKS